MAHRVPFVVAELRADVDPFVLQRFAALAEQERSLADIDANRQASQEPRRGATLGSPKLYPEALKAATAPFRTNAADIWPIIRDAEGRTEHDTRRDSGLECSRYPDSSRRCVGHPMPMKRAGLGCLNRRFRFGCRDLRQPKARMRSAGSRRGTN
jgi:hypothetical protein